MPIPYLSDVWRHSSLSRASGVIDDTPRPGMRRSSARLRAGVNLRRLAAVVILAAFLLASCADGADDAGSTSTSTPPTAPSAPSAPVVRWGEDIGVVDLGGGWSLTDAEGNGPFTAVRLDGTTVGTIELVRFPIATLPVVRDVVAGGGSPGDALLAHAAEYLAAFEDDRHTGCGPAYAFAPEPTRLVEGASSPLVHYGFRGGSPVTERQLQWATISGDDLVLVTVSAYDDGGCLAREGHELTVEQLDALAARLGAAVEASPLPA